MASGKSGFPALEVRLHTQARARDSDLGRLTRGAAQPRRETVGAQCLLGEIPPCLATGVGRRPFPKLGRPQEFSLLEESRGRFLELSGLLERASRVPIVARLAKGHARALVKLVGLQKMSRRAGLARPLQDGGEPYHFLGGTECLVQPTRREQPSGQVPRRNSFRLEPADLSEQPVPGGSPLVREPIGHGGLSGATKKPDCILHARVVVLQIEQAIAGGFPKSGPRFGLSPAFGEPLAFRLEEAG